METLKYTSSSGVTDVYVGASWQKLDELINPEKTIVLSDTNVAKHYRDKFPGSHLLIISPGEKSKSVSTAEAVIKDMLKLQVDRSWFLLGIGGGVVCDLAGFVASVFMRGIRFGYVSTSLLSQVDASTGGKTGVNSSGYKNVIGTFSQPEFVICDPALLKTLPEEEFRSGLAELVKHAIIKDARLLSALENEKTNISKDNTTLLEKLITRSVKIKISVVEKDEKEKGLRRILNFGHTIGHAIESISKVPHGIAVARGMYLSSQYSYEKKYINEQEFDRIAGLLKDLGLVDARPRLSLSMIEPVLRDKKRESSGIFLVVLRKPGKAEIEETDINEFTDWLRKQV